MNVKSDDRQVDLMSAKKSFHASLSAETIQNLKIQASIEQRKPSDILEEAAIAYLKKHRQASDMMTMIKKEQEGSRT